MLEGTADIRRGSFSDALRAARAEIVTWSAADAGITDLRPARLADRRQARVRPLATRGEGRSD